MVRRRSTVRFCDGARRWPGGRSSPSGLKLGGVAQGQSRRLIIAESVVRVHPPLPHRSSHGPGRAEPGSGPLNPCATRTEEVRGGVPMTQRFCPLCATEVQDVGGYCRLGHRLRLDPPQASLGDLRDEVDRAFDEAELVVAQASAGVASSRSGRVPPPSPTQAHTRPASPVSRESRPTARRGLSAPSDPITAFAPPPRMDWGPERPWRTRLSRLAPTWGRRGD